MKKHTIEKIEEIYPLTIITMRYGGKIVIFNSESDNVNINNVQLSEEFSYGLIEWMETNISPQCYGIGTTIWEAFEDYKKRYYG